MIYKMFLGKYVQVDVRKGVVAVLRRCPAVDDVLERVEVVQFDVRVQDAEGGAESEEIALELYELTVALLFQLSQPSGAVTPPDVQWVVIALSSCHSS